MRYASLCSGIEAASLAWEPLGWTPAWFAEIEPFPCAVLAHRWPHVPNHGDMTKLVGRILTGEIEAPDILVGGTPCQAFSVAGLRGSLKDERGNLTLVMIRILDAIDFIRARAGKPPCILVWENVPGVLNTRDNAFGCLLGGLAGEDIPLEPAGKKWTNAGAVFGHRRRIAWRILDAQYFGVPQRRRRVFLVAGAGSIDPAAILFERQSKAGHPAALADAGQNPAAFIEGSFGSYKQSAVCGTVRASGGAVQGGSETLLACRMRGFGDYTADSTASTVKARDYKDATDLIVVHGRQDPCVSTVAHTLDCEQSGNTNVLCIAGNTIERQPENGGNGIGVSQTAYTLTANDRHAVQHGLTVRRLTPLECERLQGMPDNHTQIPWRGKDAEACPDAPRYKAVGNSMAVPVMGWIGQQIKDFWKVYIFERLKR